VALTTRQERLGLDGLDAYTWGVVFVLALTLLYAVLQIAFVRPFLWPAGTGAALAGDPSAVMPLVARPPDVETERGQAATVLRVSAGSPADEAGIRPGDIVLVEERPGVGRVDLAGLPLATPSERLKTWRDSYQLGVRGDVAWTIRSATGGERTVALRRPIALGTGAGEEWARRHVGMLVQIVVFTGGALVLLVLRSNDLTAALSVLALALSAVGGGGPMLGAENVMPAGVREGLTIFAWIASPLAFPTIALAILYFPSRSPLLARYPLLHVVPFLAAGPMLALSLATAIYLTGVEGARGLAVWDASHPEFFYACFAAALSINVAALIEGVYRYKCNHDANERRRIRVAVYTAVPGVFAYALKDGGPILAGLLHVSRPDYAPWFNVILQGLVLLPAFGLVYAVGVERVLGPRLVLRRSLQYALASRTLTIVGALPVVALIASLSRHRAQTISEAATGSSGMYLVLIGASVAAFKYRDRARRSLDERFFREEYDARKILLSLASRVRFETNPADLASLVVTQIDEALHPETVAVLVSGVEDGRLTPVNVLHGSVESLPLDGGLVAMLRWSDDPLEIFLQDPRSPARRLPPEEQEWLECTNVALLVPVVGRDRALIAVLALAEKRSEEPYTSEDRQLLASIASQMGLGFDVARLRQRADTPSGSASSATRTMVAAPLPMTECPRCGRCEEPGVTLCPADGSPMQPVPSVPRVVDNKYRIEQLLGRGGMGAVYRARDMRLDRLVALKVVRAELVGDPEARRRFRREAQIVARLQHPSIVSVFDYGTFTDGGVYLVMELVRGEDLRRVLLREGRLDPERAIPILCAVCAAIEAAHRDGVLHRDLKPENILLPGGELAAKVLDFGVAKVMTDRGGEPHAPDGGTMATSPGVIVGTPAYMAPEQFHGSAPDARTDVFSLGVIAYEMLSGELPFGRGSLTDVILAQARGMQPMPAGMVPAPIDSAIRAALETAPDRRPASAQAFARLLDASIKN
jgi:eukaryotic-like serine/threonine-protein kinase